MANLSRFQKVATPDDVLKVLSQVDSNQADKGEIVKKRLKNRIVSQRINKQLRDINIDDVLNEQRKYQDIADRLQQNKMINLARLSGDRSQLARTIPYTEQDIDKVRLNGEVTAYRNMLAGLLAGGRQSSGFVPIVMNQPQPYPYYNQPQPRRPQQPNVNPVNQQPQPQQQQPIINQQPIVNQQPQQPQQQQQPIINQQQQQQPQVQFGHNQVHNFDPNEPPNVNANQAHNNAGMFNLNEGQNNALYNIHRSALNSEPLSREDLDYLYGLLNSTDRGLQLTPQQENQLTEAIYFNELRDRINRGALNPNANANDYPPLLDEEDPELQEGYDPNAVVVGGPPPPPPPPNMNLQPLNNMNPPPPPSPNMNLNVNQNNNAPFDPTVARANLNHIDLDNIVRPPPLLTHPVDVHLDAIRRGRELVNLRPARDRVIAPPPPPEPENVGDILMNTFANRLGAIRNANAHSDDENDNNDDEWGDGLPAPLYVEYAKPTAYYHTGGMNALPRHRDAGNYVQLNTERQPGHFSHQFVRPVRNPESSVGHMLVLHNNYGTPVEEELITPQHAQQFNAGNGIRGRGLYKLTQDGKFGNLDIDMTALYDNLKLIAHKDGKKVLSTKIDQDTFDILTKRYNSKKQYSQKAVETFNKLIELGDVNPINLRKKQNLVGSGNVSTKSKIMLASPDELIQKLAILTKKKKKTVGDKNMISEIADTLLKLKVIDEEDHKKIFSDNSIGY